MCRGDVVFDARIQIVARGWNRCVASTELELEHDEVAVLESRLKLLPAVAQAVVVGDGRNYLAALFTLDPLRVGAAATEAGSPARDVVSAARCPAFHAHLERALTAANAHFARFETIKRFAV